MGASPRYRCLWLLRWFGWWLCVSLRFGRPRRPWCWERWIASLGAANVDVDGFAAGWRSESFATVLLVHWSTQGAAAGSIWLPRRRRQALLQTVFQGQVPGPLRAEAAVAEEVLQRVRGSSGADIWSLQALSSRSFLLRVRGCERGCGGSAVLCVSGPPSREPCWGSLGGVVWQLHFSGGARVWLLPIVLVVRQSLRSLPRHSVSLACSQMFAPWMR